MQRMSGIATATAAMVAAAAGTSAKILDTRKTVPGLRLLDKWAVLLGEVWCAYDRAGEVILQTLGY
jgi:nicotinate-nucleotide pyrophosphorylase (carboxylating)